MNPLYPGFLRPTVGHLYVMSQSTLVRPLGNNEYLIRAGSKLFKSDTVFEATHTHYIDTGGMLPTIVRFVGTRVITVPRRPRHRHDHREGAGAARSLDANAHNAGPGPTRLRQVRNR